MTPAELAANLLAHMVKKIVAAHFGTVVEALKDETHFGNHFDADDLDRIEVVMEIERQFGVVVPNEDFTEFETVGDLLAVVRRLDAQKQQTAA
jgi:acyl carrier protein